MRQKQKTGIKKFDLHKPSKAVIYSYINARGDDLTYSYISGLTTSEKKSIIALLERFVEFGNIVNKQMFKLLTDSDGIYEFIDIPTRILCFHRKAIRPRSIVLTHGFKKRTKVTPKKQIRKAEKIKKEVLALEKEGKLKIYEA